MGELVAGSSLTPHLRLFGPEGALLDTFGSGGVAAEVAVRATNSGTFTVVAADQSGAYRGVGAYRLKLAKTGSPITVLPSDEGGSMTNGVAHTGSVEVGGMDVWSFEAARGDNLVVRMGELIANSPLTPLLRLYGPNGALLDSYGSGGLAAEVSARATNSGAFMVVASDLSAGYSGSGAYRLKLAKTGGPFVVSPNDEGGTLTNGLSHRGNIDVGDMDLWSFEADRGDSIVVRMGELLAGSSLSPQVRLFGPDGALLDSYAAGGVASEVAVRATNTGTFLVLATDLSSVYRGSGTYRLKLAKTGSPIVVRPDDEGGPLTNGVLHTGLTDIGDLDVWSFTASTGDSIIVRMGELAANSSLTPYLRLFGPNGALLGSFGSSAVAAEIATRATNSGVFTLVATDLTSVYGGSGAYRLTLAKSGAPVVISPGDDGGPMLGVESYEGGLDVGDADVWSFTACAGDVISASVSELVSASPLTPSLRVYGRDGVLLRTATGVAAAQVDLIAPSSGSYTLVLTDLSSAFSGSGTYRLTVNGLADSLKLCRPELNGADLDVTGVGGVPGNPFILLTTTNIVAPVTLWEPVETNQFDAFGVFLYTNRISPAEPERYYRVKLP